MSDEKISISIDAILKAHIPTCTSNIK